MAQQNLAARDYFTDESLLTDPFPYYEAVRSERTGLAGTEPRRLPRHRLRRDPRRVPGPRHLLVVQRLRRAVPTPARGTAPRRRLRADRAVPRRLRLQRELHHLRPAAAHRPPRTHDAPAVPDTAPGERAIHVAGRGRGDRPFVERGTCEFVAEYAQPFSMLIIADLLGVPVEDRGALRERIKANVTPGAVGQPPAVALLEYLEEFFTAYIEDRRRQPRDDVLTQMAHGAVPRRLAAGRGRRRARRHHPLRRRSGHRGTASHLGVEAPRRRRPGCSRSCATIGAASPTSSRRYCASRARPR